MSAFDSFAAQSLAPFMTQVVGEPVTITPKGGQATSLTAVVLRGHLQTRQTDGNSQPQYELQIQVAMRDYPGTIPTLKGDAVELFVRKGDAVKSRRIIAAILGQTGAMWTLGLS